MTAAFAALFGLAFGSFANAAIDRIPRGVSLHGRSRCDGCGATLSVRHLIPLLSYVAQRGRCDACASPIGLRTPLVEAGSAVAFAIAFATLPAALAAVASAGFIAAVIVCGAGAVKRSARP